MHATKRKFNALIQGIGTRPTSQSNDDIASHNPPTTEGSPPPLARIPTSNSNTSIPPAPENMTTPTAAAVPRSSISADFLAKRRRMGALGSVTGNDNTTSKMTITNITHKKWTRGGKEVKSADASSRSDSPRYCPGDRDQLIRRLGTFQELTQWTPKPDRVNEIEWAKRGWVCQGKETVHCTLCHKELVVNMKKKEVDGKETTVLVGSDFEQALGKKFAEMIVGAHEEDCLWRKQGCDDSLLRLQITSAQTALPALRQRYDELCARPAFLPYSFNLRLPDSLDMDTVKSYLPHNFSTEPPPPSTTSSAALNDVALALALLGWGGLTNSKIGPVPNSASCSTCLRRIGLWMFKSKEVNQETGEILAPAPMDHLDPVREHRFFCPWRNPDTQRNPGSKAAEPSKAAWEIMVLTVRNAARLRGDTPRKDKTLSHSRSKSNIVPGTLGTPRKGHAPTASDGALESPLLVLGPDMVEDEEDDENARDAKDKERWARLRRVKSIFNTKNGKNRLSRTLSRPGTAKSSATTGEGTKE